MIVGLIAALTYAALATLAWWNAAGRLCLAIQQVHAERRAANTYKRKWVDAMSPRLSHAVRDTLTEAIGYLGEAHKHQEEYPNRAMAERDAERREINRIRGELKEIRDAIPLASDLYPLSAMPAVEIRFAADEEPVRVSPVAMRRLALRAAERCEALSVISQTEEDADLLKETQNTHDWAEFLYYRLTGEHLPTTVVGPKNCGGGGL